jgi:CRP-like cAMP-binding protein
MLVENRRVGNLERVLFLKTIPTLAKLPSAELAALAEHARELFFARGSALMRDGEPVRAVYHVLDGSVRLRRHGRDLGLADRRTAVGALLLLARDEQGLSAVAESDAFTLGLDADSFLEVLEERFAIFHGVLRELSRDLVALMTRAPADARAGVPAAPLPRLPERDLDLVGRLQLLRSRRPFARSSIDAIAELSQRLDEDRFAPGSVLWREGDLARQMLLIVSGSVRCESRGGARFTAGAGQPLGELDALGEVPRWHDAVAESAVCVLSGPVEQFLDVFEDNFAMAVDYLSYVGEWSLALHERVAEREGSALRL